MRFAAGGAEWVRHDRNSFVGGLDATVGIRVGIAEDQLLIARMLQAYVGSQADMELAWVVGDGREALVACASDPPDVVLMDISMPEMDGITATGRIGRLYTGVAVLMLSAYSNEDNVFRAARVGAKGFLQKNSSPEEVVSAIRVVAGGGAVLSAEIAERALLVSGKGDGNAGEDFAPELTRREVEVIRGVARGMSNRQIAASMRISERTVRNHAANIYGKLGVHDRTQAVLHAVRRGVVDPYASGDV